MFLFVARDKELLVVETGKICAKTEIQKYNILKLRNNTCCKIAELCKIDTDEDPFQIGHLSFQSFGSLASIPRT